jgi:hypothetical protein
VRPLLLGAPLGRHQLAHPGPRGIVCLRRLGDPLPDAVVGLGVDPGRLAGALELLVRLAGARVRLAQRLGQPVDLLGVRRDAAAQRLRSAGQRGEPGTAVGQRPDGGQVGAFRGGERRLVLGSLLQHLREPLPGILHGLDQLRLLLGDDLGLGLQLVRVAPRRPRVTGVGEVACSLLRQPDGAAQALGQRREPVPGVLCGRQPRRVLGQGVLQPLLLGAGDSELLLDLEAAGPGDRLVRLLAGQLAAQGHEVVRGQP